MLRIAPGCSAAIDRRANSVEQKNVPSRTVVVTARQAFGLISSARTGKLPAALFTRTPIAPAACSTPSKAWATAAGSRTSHSIPMPRPPASLTATMPSSRCSGLRLVTATVAPNRPNSAAIARPIPVPPPVITTTVSSNVRGGSMGAPAGSAAGYRFTASL
jgi:hypothetical protein